VNILYIAHRLPYPPNKGEKIRAFHQILHLSRRHSVHVACIVDERRDMARNVAGLERHCRSVDAVFRDGRHARLLAGLAIVRRKPLSVAGFYSRELARRIRARIGTSNIDRIFVYCSQMAEYVMDVSGIPRLIDFVDVDSDKWRLYAMHRRFPLSWIFELEYRRLARYEETVARAFDRSILVTQREASLLGCRVGTERLSVIPNGVDLDHFQPTGDEPSAEPSLVFTGVMDYFPNVDAVQHFCTEILPLLVRDQPKLKFVIVGRNPTAAVLRLGDSPNVTVTGEVADVRPFLSRASLAAIPLRISRGVQNKILEAMAMGLPVVTTTEAAGGIGAGPRDGVTIGDQPRAFADEVLRLLQDPVLRRSQGIAARRYVECHHRWDTQGADLEALIESAGASVERA